MGYSGVFGSDFRQTAAQSWVLTSAEDGVEKGNWQITSEALKVKDKTFSIEQKVLHGGKQEGSKVRLSAARMA